MRKKVQFSLHRDVAELIDRVSGKRRLTKSSLVELAILNYLKNEKEEKKKLELDI